MNQHQPLFTIEQVDEQVIQQIRQLIMEQTGQAPEDITREQLQEQLMLLLAEEVEYNCIHTLFEQQAEKTPDAIAIVHGEQQFTYDCLNQRANQLARFLITQGVGPDTLVGIFLERSADLLIGLLGILKAGGAYVPLDQTYPDKYLANILQGACVTVLLTQTSLQGTLSKHATQTLCLNTLWETFGEQSTTNLDVSVTPECLAYVMDVAGYRVEVEHASVHNRLKWLQNEFSLTGDDAVLQHTSLLLSPSILEVFWSLAYGARVVVSIEAHDDNAQYLYNTTSLHAITIVHFTPSILSDVLRICIRSVSLSLQSLRAVLCSGEPLYQEIVEIFHQHIGSTLYNLYAPPEAGEVTAHICQPDSLLSLVPIGHVTTGSLYILDSYLQPTPTGVIGDLYIASDTLARGYLHNAEITHQRFPASPFADQTAGRLFKTGDRGRRLSDGSFELVGSMHGQIWTNGYRLDLLTIQSTLLAAPGIQDCIVLCRQTDTLKQELVAYIISNGLFLAERIQEYMRQHFPTSLLPGAYVPITHLPLTPEGQVDEQQLTQLSVLDANLIQRWETQVRALPGIDQAALIVQAQEEKGTALHLSDLLPDWKGALDERDSGNAEEDEAQELQTVEDEQSVRMAWSDGGPLFIPHDAPKTLTQALVETAIKYQDKGIIYVQSDGSQDFQSYADLLHEAKCILSGLRLVGMSPGDRAILQVETLREHFATFWACVLGGMIPITVAVAQSYNERNSVVNKLHNIWELLDRPPIIARASLTEVLKNLCTLLPMEDLRVLVVDTLITNEPATQVYESTPEDIVFYQLTSGSTGIPKCIQETHRGIVCHIHAAQQFNNYASSDISLNWLPVDHVVPILTCHLKDVYLGTTQIEVCTETILSQPLKWLDYIDKYRVTHTWSPNFGYKLVSDRLSKGTEKSWDLSSIQYFLNAGEQVTLQVVSEFLRLVAPFHVKPCAMQPSFGMAEACTCMTFQRDFDLVHGVHRIQKSSLGRRLRLAVDDDPRAINFVDLGGPVPGIQIRITDSNNQLVCEGVIGRFQIKGLVITPGYYKNAIANDEAFVGDGWFNSGDLGFILNGRLTLTGREKEIIVINGANHYCYEIEDVINGVHGVLPTFVGTCGVADPKTGTEGLAIFFTPTVESIEERIALIQTIRIEVTTKIGLNPLFIVPIEKQLFPKTTSGKIQRTQLKRSLQTGEFDALLKTIDIYQANSNTLPDWFYEPIWVPRVITYSSLNHLEGKTTLLLSDTLGLGKQIQTYLEHSSLSVARIESGDRFERVDINHYIVDPLQREHYEAVIGSLCNDGREIGLVLHLQAYSDSMGEPKNSTLLAAAQQRLYASLLCLVQALQSVFIDHRSIDLYLVGSQMQGVQTTDSIALEKLTLTGLLKTISQEFPWIGCRQIDLPLVDLATNVAILQEELSCVQGEVMVAYRNGRRLVQRLHKLQWAQEPTQESPLLQGGFYLLSGGLGGIGFELAHYLLKHYNARLLLLGRQPLPPRDQWAQLIAHEGDLATRLKRYLELEQAGGDIGFVAVDICDQTAIERVVHELEMHYNRSLNGIFHLAGAFTERLLIEETLASFASTLHAKVIGSWVLHQLVKMRPNSLFVTFSSVNGTFGGSAVGAYAAANSFLDALVHYQRNHTSIRGYCFAWSMWDEVGISRDYHLKALTLARGYISITRRQGLYALLAGLAHKQPQVLIGLDSSNASIRRHLERTSLHLQRGVMYFTTRRQNETVSIGNIRALRVYDRFRAHSTCDVVQLTEMPRTLSGEIDGQKLSTLQRGSHQGGSEHVEPRTVVERQLAQVWREVLGIEQVSIYNNFFDLGGYSIQVMQLISKANQVGLRFTLQQLFQHQTVAELATVITTTTQTRTEQEDIVGPVPLLPSQAWFFERDLPNPHHFNQSLRFEVVPDVDTTHLEQIVASLLQHHEMLRVQFVHTPSGWQQFDPGLPQIVPFSCIDLSTLPSEEQNAAITAEELKLQLSMNLLEGSLIRCVLFRLGKETPLQLLIIVHHLIIDGISWRILLEDFQTAYTQIRQAKRIHLPPRTTSGLYWAKQLSALAQYKALQNELKYWLADIHKKVVTVPLDFHAGENLVASSRAISVALSVAETRVLQEAARGYRVHFDVILLAAVARAFAPWIDAQPLLIDLVNHGREALVEGADVSRSVGWFSMNVPVLFNVENTSEPRELIRLVSQQLDAIPQHGIGYNLLRYLSQDEQVKAQLKAMPHAQILLSYLGRFDLLGHSNSINAEQTLLGSIIKSNQLDDNPNAPRPYVLLISTVIADEQLRLNIGYSQNLHRPATIEAFTQRCLTVLRALIAEEQSSSYI